MANHVLIKIITFLIISGIIYLIYTNHYQNTDQIVTIHHDSSPIKVKPRDNGRIVIPNANNIIYENLQQKKIRKVITLQPEPEKPLNIAKQRVAHNDEELDPIDMILFSIIENGKTKNDEEIKTVLSNKIKNKSVQKKFLIKPQSIPVVQLPDNKDSLNIIKVTEPRRKINEIQLLNRLNQGGYKIQLASVKSESEANIERERIKKKYARIFTKTNISIKKVQSHKGNFFYLVLAGNYQNISQAKIICKKLSDQQSCIITNR